MAGGFTVTISAVDKLTATLNKINKTTRDTAKPFHDLQASVSRFLDTSGLRNVGNALGDVGRSASDTFQRISSILSPLGVITGAASLAGMYRMVSSWAEWGTQLRNVSQSVGVSAQKLGQWEGAAQIAGASAGAMSSSMENLSKNLYDAAGGRNNDVVALLGGWNIQLKKTTYQAQNLVDVLPQIADKISKFKDPQAQEQAASVLGISAILPWIRRGAAGMREYQAEAAKYLHMTATSAEHADQFRMAQTKLTLAVKGFTNQLSDRLAPVIGPILTRLADWIATSPQVTQGIDAMGQAVKEFADWLTNVDWKSAISWAKGWGETISSLTGIIGGPRQALEAMFMLMGARFATNMIAPWVNLGTAVTKTAVLLGPGLLSAVASPAGMVVAAIAAIGVAGYELYKHWDSVSSKFRGMWDTLKSMFENNSGYIRTTMELLFPVPMYIIGHWSKIGPFFSKLWSGVTDAFSSAWDYISPIFEKLKSAIDWIGNSWVGRKLAGIEKNVSDGVVSAAGWAGRTASNAAGKLDRFMGFASSGVPYKAGTLLKDTGASQDQYGIFARTIAGRESAGKYDLIGGAGNAYTGRYQMGQNEIREAAGALGEAAPSRDQFLHDPKMQERYFEAYTDINDRYLAAHSASFRAANTATQLSMLGYAHLVGRGAAANWINNGVVSVDGNKVAGTEYYNAVNSNLAAQASGPAIASPAAAQPAQASVNGKIGIHVTSDKGLTTATTSQDGDLKNATVQHSSLARDGY